MNKRKKIEGKGIKRGRNTTIKSKNIKTTIEYLERLILDAGGDPGKIPEFQKLKDFSNNNQSSA